jgi:ABC-type branched-subunit amino acid transport system ATPase component
MVLLDEPSMGLAPQLVEEIFEIVKDLNKEEGVSFLLASRTTSRLRYADTATSWRTEESSWTARASRSPTTRT